MFKRFINQPKSDLYKFMATNPGSIPRRSASDLRSKQPDLFRGNLHVRQHEIDVVFAKSAKAPFKEIQPGVKVKEHVEG